MAQEPAPQPPVVGPLAGDGSTASPEELASARRNAARAKSPDREPRSFAEDVIEKPYRGGPIGPDGDDDPDERGPDYCPTDEPETPKP